MDSLNTSWTKKILKKHYIASRKLFAKRKRKRIVRKSTRSYLTVRFNDYIQKGIPRHIDQSLYIYGFNFLLRHSIKKGQAARQYFNILQFCAIIKIYLNRIPLRQAFIYLFRRITPLIKFLPKTYGRTVYKIPVKSVLPYNLEHAIHKLVKFARQRSEETFSMQLAAEFLDSLKLKSRTIKWKQELHLEAFNNRANLTHLRYL